MVLTHENSHAGYCLNEAQAFRHRLSAFLLHYSVSKHGMADASRAVNLGLLLPNSMGNKGTFAVLWLSSASLSPVTGFSGRAEYCESI